MVRRDLERIGIPYETEAGIADFHLPPVARIHTLRNYSATGRRLP